MKSSLDFAHTSSMARGISPAVASQAPYQHQAEPSLAGDGNELGWLPPQALALAMSKESPEKSGVGVGPGKELQENLPAGTGVGHI